MEIIDCQMLLTIKIEMEFKDALNLLSRCGGRISSNENLCQIT